jgi:hypothetical protein
LPCSACGDFRWNAVVLTDIPPVLLQFATSFATALVTAAGFYFVAKINKKSAIATAELATASGLEGIKQQALIEVYDLAKDQRTELKEAVRDARGEVLRERELRVKLGERIGGLEIEVAHLRGAHELLLRLQCPRTADGTCPVFQPRPDVTALARPS